jgi:dTDP-4-amino-4,6-dideoxygalactose transaminase
MSVVGAPLDWAAVPQIPLVDVKAQYAPLLDELKERIGEVLESGRFILGPHVHAFEEEAATYLGAKHAIGVANGTDALVLALDALDIGPGDEVVCPSFTFYATAEAIVRRGATPVFAEVDARTLNLDSGDVRRRVTPKTKAILPVHLFGRPADLEGLVGLGIPIVEDAAQAFGAQGVGRTGVISTYSFFPTKNLFALGDGGLVTTDDDDLADRIRLLRFHGSREKQEFELVGYNSRLDELQAALLRVFLPHLEEWNRSRREAAARYAELGLGEVCELPADDPGHVYHVYVIRSPERDRIREYLAEASIASTAYYETPLHRQPALRFLGQSDGDFAVTEGASRENLALPLWAGIGADVQEAVVEAVREAVSLEPVR